MRLKIAIVLWFGCGGVAAASDRQVVVVLLLDVVDDVIDVDAQDVDEDAGSGADIVTRS